jgi:hypothetical protein
MPFRKKISANQISYLEGYYSNSMQDTAATCWKINAQAKPIWGCRKKRSDL